MDVRRKKVTAKNRSIFCGQKRQEIKTKLAADKNNQLYASKSQSCEKNLRFVSEFKG